MMKVARVSRALRLPTGIVPTVVLTCIAVAIFAAEIVKVGSRENTVVSVFHASVSAE